MATDDDFQRLIDRVSQDDELAAAELVQQYEQQIRLMVRTWLRPWENRFRKVFDSQDICQSVLAWFFLKGAARRYDLSSPEDLRKLFLVMVRNRVHYRIRQSHMDKRSTSLADDIKAPSASAEDKAEQLELLELIERKLEPQEASLARRRMEGRSWDEIAEEFGGTANARRMQLARAAQRLTELTMNS